MATGYTWVKDTDLRTLKARVKNIRIRMLENIATPSVSPFGSGDSAGILISLPKNSSSKTVTAYACRVTGAPTAGIYPVTFHYERNGDQIGSGYSIPLTLHISDVVAVGEWFVGVPSQSTILPAEDES